jgi:hypothetical protein
MNTTYKGQTIGGIFSSRENADQAIKAFRELDISEKNIEVVVRLDDKQAKDAYANLLKGGGFSGTQALYFDRAVEIGKTVVAVYEVTNPAPVIDIFDKYKAEQNPNGSRNVRQDVVGMTTGAMIVSAALGAVGAVVAGPAGAMAGAIAGAVVGGGSGASAGKVAEHSK